MSNSKIATPYKTNELDMVTSFRKRDSYEKVKKGGGILTLAGDVRQNQKTIKNQLVFPFRFDAQF